MSSLHGKPQRGDPIPTRSNWLSILTFIMVSLLIFIALYVIADEQTRIFHPIGESLYAEILISILVIGLAVFVSVQVTLQARSQRRILEALRESEERYRTLFERVPVGLYRTTPEGKILDANPALIEMLGYPDRETFLAVNAYQVYVDPHERERLVTLLGENDLVSNYPLQLRCYDGSEIWVEDTLRAVRSAEGEIQYFDGSLKDISDRKQAEEMRSLLASIVESSEDAIVGEDLEGHVLSWNAGARRIFGYSAEEITQQPFLSLVAPDHAAEFSEILAKVKRGEEAIHLETVGVKKDGEKIDLSVVVSPIKNSAGGLIGISYIARDITHRKNMERYMLQAERLAAMGSISAALAHEVKNPLQAIRSNLELVLEFPLEPDEKENCLEVCQQEVERLMSITQRVLSFARSEKRVVQPFSFSEVWKGALELMKRALEVASITVIDEVPDDLPPIPGNSDQVSQVLVNLLLNAIESMPEGGIIKGTALLEDAQLAFTMINNGPPIPIEYLDQIFDPFFTTKTQGSGLGLFICHNIIREHGGTIVVANLSEGGVAFTIRLPVLGEHENH